MNDTDGQPACDVNESDQDTCDGISADVFASTVHGPKEVCLTINSFASPNGLGLIDQAGMKVGVDGHLATWQAVEHESGRHFADPARAFGDDDKLDDHHDAEHDHTDQNIVACDERSK